MKIVLAIVCIVLAAILFVRIDFHVVDLDQLFTIAVAFFFGVFVVELRKEAD